MKKALNTCNQLKPKMVKALKHKVSGGINTTTMQNKTLKDHPPIMHDQGQWRPRKMAHFITFEYEMFHFPCVQTNVQLEHVTPAFYYSDNLTNIH